MFSLRPPLTLMQVAGPIYVSSSLQLRNCCDWTSNVHDELITSLDTTSRVKKLNHCSSKASSCQHTMQTMGMLPMCTTYILQVQAKEQTEHKTVFPGDSEPLRSIDQYMPVLACAQGSDPSQRGCEFTRLYRCTLEPSRCRNSMLPIFIQAYPDPWLDKWIYIVLT